MPLIIGRRVVSGVASSWGHEEGLLVLIYWVFEEELVVSQWCARVGVSWTSLCDGGGDHVGFLCMLSNLRYYAPVSY